jgi:enoyl-CoA hydratase/carnithine racemase
VSESEEVLVTRKPDGVVWVTLNREGARNALSLAVNKQLKKLATEFEEDKTVRAVVLTGAGTQAFCAGADLKERKGVSADKTRPYVDAISGAITAIAELNKPTFAAMNGSAYGGGLELALACDFRIAVETAEFALTEVRLGIMPGAGGTQRMTRLIGVARAKELILLGRKIDARRACDMGLVHAVVRAGALESTVNAWLLELGGCAPMSVSMAKQAIDDGIGLPIDKALELERKLYEVTLFTEDRNEGLRAFAEKRPPQFRGQ